MPRLFRPPNPDTPVNHLWNLSDLTASWLNDLGIYTYSDLAQKDLLKIWSELKLVHKQVSKLMYYALWGAVSNSHWKNIPAQEIKKIEQFIKTFKNTSPAKIEIAKKVVKKSLKPQLVSKLKK